MAASRRRILHAIAALAAGLLWSSPCLAVEFFDGRFQAHGFFESQMRILNADFSEQYDVAQWYQVFNLELEFDFAPDGFGPFDLLTGYTRLEVRYDCIYSRGCGMFRSMRAFGDRSKALPRRLSNGTFRLAGGQIPQEFDEFANGDAIATGERISGHTRDPLPLSRTAGFLGFAAQPGADDFSGSSSGLAFRDFQGLEVPRLAGVCEKTIDCAYFTNNVGNVSPGLGNSPSSDPRLAALGVQTGGSLIGGPVPPGDPRTANRDHRGILLIRPSAAEQARRRALLATFGFDDPFPFVFSRFEDFRFTHIDGRGGSNNGHPVQILGPWLPKNFIKANAALADKPNPFDNFAESPILTSAVFNTEVQEFAIDVKVTLFQNFNNDCRQAFMGGATSFFSANAIGQCPTAAQTFYSPFEAEILQQAIYQAVQTAEFARGFGAAPFRPIPIREKGFADANWGAPRGLFVPSKPLTQFLLSDDGNTSLPLNFREAERAFNRGASQQDEYEFKEGYLDIELFDSRLWLRIGKQQIVWGKTELFRTTDQFNPQDVALASLPTLEESRIALWAIRGVYSLYEVGPFEDVRVEVALNIDDVEPADFGACGEPYTVNLVCGATFGIFAHGLLGVGVAGARAPPKPWESLKGIEIGGRLEWRWDRFSFALMDFYGYGDFPTIERLTTYRRNVDPGTGRPRVIGRLGRGTVYDRNQGVFVAGGFGTSVRLIPTLEPGGLGLVTMSENEARSVNPCEFSDLAGPTFVGVASADPDKPGQNHRFDPACLTRGPSDRRKVVNAQGNIVIDPNTGLQKPQPFQANGIKGNDAFFADRKFRSTDPRFTASKPFEVNALGVKVPGSDIPHCITPVGSSTATNWPCYDGPLRAGIDPVGDPTVRQNSTNLYEFTLDRLSNSLNPGRPFDPRRVYRANNALENHPGNLTLFTAVCSLTVGFNSLDTTACALTVFGSARDADAAVPGSVAELINKFFRGKAGFALAGGPSLAGTIPPVVELTRDAERPNSNFRTNQGFVRSAATGSGVLFGDRARELNQTGDAGESDYRSCNDPNRNTVCDQSLLGVFDPDALNTVLTAEQEALLGCGPFWGTNCDTSGIDLLNMEGSAILQSFIGFEGTGPRPPAAFLKANCAGATGREGWRTDGLCPGVLPQSLTILGPINPVFNTPFNAATPRYAQPGTLGFKGGPVCTTTDLGGRLPSRAEPNGQILPGCRNKWLDARPVVVGGTVVSGGTLNPFWDQTVDGDPDFMGFDTANGVLPINGVEDEIVFRGSSHPIDTGRAAGHPFTGQPFANEMAAFSWNFMMLLVSQSDEYKDLIVSDDIVNDPEGNQGFKAPSAFDITCNPARYIAAKASQPDFKVPCVGKYAPGKPICSFITPQHCGLVTTLFGVAGLTRNDVRAGGNPRFGRRTMVWQSGGDIVLSFVRRNVLGFSMDFAEDFTKTNWGIETTWIEGLPRGDVNAVDNVTTTDSFNLTISVDRPTFINFLNPNRTFFITSQWFFGYTSGWKSGMGPNGPFRVLGILAVQTGYFQDRLLPSMLFVYDVMSISGAAVPQVTYRFDERFSVSVGLSFFFGRTQFMPMSVNPIGPTSNRLGPHAYENAVETGLALVRDRDEIFVRLRYTF